MFSQGDSAEEDNNAGNEPEKGDKAMKFTGIVPNMETKTKKGKTERVELRGPREALMPNFEQSRESLKDRIFSEIRRNLRKKNLDKSNDNEIKGADTNRGKRESIA